MKKFLLLAAIICYASCKSLCNGVEDNFSPETCKNADLEKPDEDQCCFLKKGDTLKCAEFIKNITAEDIKKQDEYKDYETIDCPNKRPEPTPAPSSDNYLKAGFLLFAMLLL